MVVTLCLRGVLAFLLWVVYLCVLVLCLRVLVLALVVCPIFSVLCLSSPVLALVVCHDVLVVVSYHLRVVRIEWLCWLRLGLFEHPVVCFVLRSLGLFVLALFLTVEDAR